MKSFREHLKSDMARRYMLAAEIVLLIFASSLTGAGVSAAPSWMHKGTATNSSLYLAMTKQTPPDVALAGPTASASSVMAVEEERLGALTTETHAYMQESRDDRKLLHDELAKLANTETDHYNTLTDRLNVDEARVSTVLWIVGFVFTVIQGVLLFLQLTSRHRKHDSEEAEVATR